MSNTEQFDFGFEATEDKPKTLISSKAKKSLFTDDAMSPEAMAVALDAHPDYRVLRRLVPRLDYGPVPEGVKTQRVLVLDTETTGLDHRQERIIELAMLSVLVDMGTGLPVGPVTVFEAFEDPGKPISPEVQALTGITDDDVRGQRIDDAQVRALVQAADVVLAHNAGFDRPFVEARWPEFEDKAWACSFAGMDWKAQGAGSAKLEFLAAESGWFYDAHRAQVDCHALLQVLTAPVKDGANTRLLHLMQGTAQSRYKLRALGAPFEAKDSLKTRGYRWDADGRVWWCSLSDDAALAAETDWLKANVYFRSARVQIEKLNSQVQFSARPGEVSVREL
ncbi:MAG: polymerase PolC-type [Pseudomonadota bacterium]|jgi:DNA polymerase-3 subunit epsilon